MIYSKRELNDMAKDLLERITCFDTSKFKIHLDYVTYDNTPSIEVCENEYHLDEYERGQLVSRKITIDVQEVLYWILEYSISLFAWDTIQKKYYNPSTNRLTFNEEINQEYKDIKLNSFKSIGGVYIDWYIKKQTS